MLTKDDIDDYRRLATSNVPPGSPVYMLNAAELTDLLDAAEAGLKARAASKEVDWVRVLRWLVSGRTADKARFWQVNRIEELLLALYIEEASSE